MRCAPLMDREFSVPYDFHTADHDTIYDNTPEQREAALNVVRKFADTATLPELVAMLGLAGES